MLTQTKRYDFVPIIDRPLSSFPKNERIAVVVYVNLEHFPENTPGPSIVPQTAQLKPDPLNYGWQDYGQRVGIWRLMERRRLAKSKKRDRSFGRRPRPGLWRHERERHTW